MQHEWHIAAEKGDLKKLKALIATALGTKDAAGLQRSNVILTTLLETSTIHQDDRGQLLLWVLRLENFQLDINSESVRQLWFSALQYGWKEIIAHLIAEGIDVNLLDCLQSNALHKAVVYSVSPEVVRPILKQNISLEHRDYSGKTPLLIAAYRGEIGLLKLFVESGANVNARSRSGSNILHLIACSGIRCVDAAETYEWLFARADIDVEIRGDKGKTLFFRVAQNGWVESLKMLIKNGISLTLSREGNTVIHYAAQGRNSVPMLTFLHAQGLAIDSVGHKGMTPLLYAAQTAQTHAVEFLMNAGAKLSTCNISGQNVLHCAAMGGASENLLKLLLDKGIEVNGRSKNGKTALLYAAKGGHVAALNYLLAQGAHIQVVDNFQYNALHWAARFSKSKQMVATLLRKGLGIESREQFGRTPLLCAAKAREIEVIEFLLHEGADVHVVDARGHTVLSLAMDELGQPGSYKNDLAGKVVDLFLQQGVSVERNNDGGRHIWLTAARNRWGRVIKRLSSRVSDVKTCEPESSYNALELYLHGEREVSTFCVAGVAYLYYDLGLVVAGTSNQEKLHKALSLHQRMTENEAIWLFRCFQLILHDINPQNAAIHRVPIEIWLQVGEQLALEWLSTKQVHDILFTAQTFPPPGISDKDFLHYYPSVSQIKKQPHERQAMVKQCNEGAQAKLLKH